MTYPRVLIIAMARINSLDTSNNGLLLRNLFDGWPRENLAQIFSGGDNGDAGFFGHYYQLSPENRRFGRLFFKLKSGQRPVRTDINAAQIGSDCTSPLLSKIKSAGKQLVLDTGLYELIFRLRLSSGMLDWVHEFKPDIIFAQGYNLTFSWLPVMLKNATSARLAFLTTDDWPTYLYSGQLGEPTVFKSIMRPVVSRAANRLLSSVDIAFAFGQAMADEYSKRYSKDFIVLSHADEPQRFTEACSRRCHPAGVRTILATGVFNKFRWPLLLDANECCRQLNAQGIPARVAVLSAGIDAVGMSEVALAEYIDIFDDPGNDLLPCYLKGADLLLLAEGFDESFVEAIRLSVSTKSHLFMFCQRPILVYGNAETGVAKYAETYKWAMTVTTRDVDILFKAMKTLLCDEHVSKVFVDNAIKTTNEFHVRKVTQSKFLSALTACPFNKGVK